MAEKKIMECIPTREQAIAYLDFFGYPYEPVDPFEALKIPERLVLCNEFPEVNKIRANRKIKYIYDFIDSFS